MRVLTTAGVLGLMLAGAGAASAQNCEACRALVTVTGTSDVKVVPDSVDLRAGVQIREKDVAAGLAQQQAKVAQVLALVRKFGVAEKDFQTDHVRITPVYKDERNNIGGSRVIDYYQLDKTISMTLRDPKRFDELLAALIGSGVNQVFGIQFKVTEIRKHRDQARELAVAAAKEKALAMARQLGQQVGRAFTIVEISQDEPRPMMAMRMSANVAMESDGAGGEESGLALGQVSVRAQVRVSFELQ